MTPFILICAKGISLARLQPYIADQCQVRARACQNGLAQIKITSFSVHTTTKKILIYGKVIASSHNRSAQTVPSGTTPPFPA